MLGSLLIFASLLVHGFTATPLTRMYGKYIKGNDKKENLGSGASPSPES